MSNEVAEALLRLEGRITDRHERNPWFLAWQLMVGATYSLVRAAALLPRQDPDLNPQTTVLLESMANGRPLDEERIPTWLLGFFLNSAEFRIQSALDRLLKAYLPPSVKARTRACRALKESRAAHLSPDVVAILAGFCGKGMDTRFPGGSLNAIWDRVNKLKHENQQDPSDHLGFGMRLAECTTGAREVVSLLEGLGVNDHAIAAA